MLCFTLGGAYLKAGDGNRAIASLARAVELDPDYSAAWKLYGKALVEVGRNDAAAVVYQRGIDIANQRGDIQAAKEMQVFLRRLQKQKAQ